MQPLAAEQLLTVWERGRGKSPAERALLLLTASCPETPADALARLTIGQRDARLLTLREEIFGSRLFGLASCPGCGACLEAEFSAAEVRAVQGGEPAEVLTLAVGDHDLQFRLPTSADLLSLAGEQDLELARRRLLRQCVLDARRRGVPTSAEDLPPEVVDVVAAHMAGADPQADVQLLLDCPSCQQPWQVPFDIVTFFWSDIETWAHRLLREVHTLASAYGWREADILALSPQRRQVYLDMVSG